MVATYVLIMLMWVPSGQSSGAIATAEFADRLSCEAAARQAKKVFEGPIATLYFVCAPKSAQ
jgi:hypothetical protein